MASIIAHTSTGASNTPKTLSITGGILALPQTAKQWLDYQIDSGLTVVAGEVTHWKDSINGNIVKPHDTSYKPTADAARQLNGISTPKFGGTFPNYKMLTLDIVTNPPVGATSITNCILVYPGDQSGVVFTVEKYLYTAPYKSGAIHLNATTNAITVMVGTGATTSYVYPGSVTPNAWNVIIVTVDYTANTVTAYINGVSAGVHALDRDQSYNQITDIKMNDNDPFNGNIAVALSWYDAVFTAGEYQDMYDYLVLKYGLT